MPVTPVSLLFAGMSKRNHHPSASQALPSPVSYPDGSSSSAAYEKNGPLRSSNGWQGSVDYFSLRVPMTRRSVSIPVPSSLSSGASSRPLAQSSSSSANRLSAAMRRRPFITVLLVLTLLFYTVSKLRHHDASSDSSSDEENTLILSKSDLLRVWKYELDSGRHPSRLLPAALPNRTISRNYLELDAPDAFSVKPAEAERLAYPPRPLPRAAIDLDVVMEHCDFSTGKYVRDCLEMLRMGGGLDPQRRLRRGDKPEWRHMYRDEEEAPGALAGHRVQYKDNYTPVDVLDYLGFQSASQKRDAQQLQLALGHDDEEVRQHKQKVQQEHAEDTNPKFDLPASFRTPQPGPRRVGAGSDRSVHPMHPEADPACDPENPQIFHIFWAGPFTDKPYLAALSFLFTQNLGLHHPIPDQAHDFAAPLSGSARDQHLSRVCRPQLWIWINPGPAAAVPDPTAHDKMFATLAANEWSAPLLHRRFEESIKFKLWNTTEQLDGVPELREHWRALPLFNSGGVKYNTPAAKSKPTKQENVPAAQAAPGDANNAAPVDGQDGKQQQQVAGTGPHATAGPSPTDNSNDAPSDEDELYARVGSLSSSDYDRLSVVLSDMARFVLTHRFGGIYLDADTLLLRDWEPLFHWTGAFGYRWSRLEKYNTAVLKMGRNTALGSMLFKTALANGLDFHPMTISRYSKDANLEALLRRLPDALFDPAWLKYVLKCGRIDLT